MNKQRRKRIENVIRKIELVKTEINNSSEYLQNIKKELEDILYEEENYFDNMPENLQGSMRGEAAEEAIDYLTEAIDSIDDALNKTDLDDMNDSLDEAIDNLEYI